MKKAVIWCAVSSKTQVGKDKISLQEQEKLGRDWCNQNGHSVIDILTVPGHSRSESDIFTAFEELAAVGCFAYHKLREHFRARDFDTLIAFDSSRLARSQTLYSFVVENVIKSGAQIYLIQGGKLDADNVDLQIALGGIAATSGIKRLTQLTKAAMLARMDRGLTMNAVPMTHRLVYDPTSGKATHLEIREELRRLWEDAADLILQGVGWVILPHELKQRFGHINPDTGRAYSPHTFWRVFHGPYTWGVSAINYENQDGLWAFDEDQPLPPGVKVNRHPNPPIPCLFIGERATQIKAELRRRKQLIRGTARPHNSYCFTGLMVCEDCGYRFVINRRHGVTYYRCSRRIKNATQSCANRVHIREEVAIEQIDRLLVRWVNSGTVDFGVFSNDDSASAFDRISAIENTIEDAKKQIDTLIRRQSTASDEVQELYAAQILEAGQRLKTLQDELQHSRQEVESADVVYIRQKAFDRLRETDIKDFWQADSQYINQTLHQIMGKHRFRVLGGEIIDIT